MLIIAMIMLLLITMASITRVRATTMDERWPATPATANKALQAADAAVRTCLKRSRSTFQAPSQV